VRRHPTGGVVRVACTTSQRTAGLQTRTFPEPLKPMRA
jgi:hypothetical protein